MKNKHEKLIEKKWNLFMRTFRFLTVACGLIKISPTSVPHQMGLQAVTVVELGCVKIW